MADRPGTNSYRRASRATVVIRKAREADAERVAARPDNDEAEGRKKILSGRHPSPAPADAPAAPAAAARPASRTSRRTRATVVIRRKDSATVVARRKDAAGAGDASTSTRDAASVLVAGGDTITRYESGEVVVRRADREGGVRRPALLLYVAGYVLLFGLYGYFMLTGTYQIEPEEYLSRAFARRHSSSVADLELAALTAMRGNRTPGEMRLASQISFYDEDRNTVTIEAGERLTLADSVQLAHAISTDQSLPEERRAFRSPLTLYRDTFLGSVDWPHILSLYNALGFFLLLGLFLWRPLARYLATEGKKTAVALRNAREAIDEEESSQSKLNALAAEADAKARTLRADAAASAEVSLAAAREAATREAEEMAGASAAALASEARGRTAALAAGTALAACDRARELLAGRLGQAEHDAAIENLISGISGLNASVVPAHGAGGA